MSKATVYGTRFCPFCNAAKQLLQQQNVAYEYVAMDGNQDLQADIMDRSGQRTVPQIWLGNTHVGGFDDLRKAVQSGEINALLQRG